MAKRRLVNPLRTGVLGAAIQSRPEDPRYPMGLEKAENVLYVGDRLIPIPGYSTPVPFRYRAQQMPPQDQNFYLRNTKVVSPLTYEQTALTDDIFTSAVPAIGDDVLLAAMASSNYASKIPAQVTITGSASITFSLTIQINQSYSVTTTNLQRAFAVSVPNGSNPTAIATLLAAAINADKNKAFTATSSAGVLSIFAVPYAAPSVGPTTETPSGMYGNMVLPYTLDAGQRYATYTINGVTLTGSFGDGGFGLPYAPSGRSFVAATAQWGTVLSTSVNLKATVPVTYVMGYTFTDGTVQKWGMACVKTVSWTLEHKNPSGMVQASTSGTWYTTTVIGTGATVVSNVTTNALADGSSDVLTVTNAIIPILYSFSQGLLGYNGKTMTVVGRIEMFLGQGAGIRDYSPSFSLNTSSISSDGTTTYNGTIACPNVSTSGVKSAIPTGFSGAFVIQGTAASNGGYVDPDLVPASTGDKGFDYIVQSVASFPVTTVASPYAKCFKFVTNRTIQSQARRYGKAIYYDSGATQTATIIGFGAAATGAGNTTTIPTASTTGTDAYFLTFPDGPPEWYETTPQGIIVGTQGSEYLVSNEQIAPGTFSINTLGQYSAVSVKKISSGGCPLHCDDMVGISTMLGGNCYYLDELGVTKMAFSQSQTQTPDHYNLVQMGFGTPQSMGSSRRFGTLFVKTDRTVVCINVDTGTITTLTLVNWSDSSGNRFFLKGIDTVANASDPGVVVQEPLFIWASVEAGVTTYYETQLAIGTQGPTASIRTTRFGAGDGVRARITKAYLEVIETRGGRMRVAKPRSQGKPNPYVELPYTAEQFGDPNDPSVPNYLGLTGVIEYDLTDRFDVKSEGKAIEVQWLPSEPFQLVSIGVDLEEVV